jgi:hypothetical protein
MQELESEPETELLCTDSTALGVGTFFDARASNHNGRF